MEQHKCALCGATFTSAPTSDGPRPKSWGGSPVNTRASQTGGLATGICDTCRVSSDVVWSRSSMSDESGGRDSFTNHIGLVHADWIR